MSVCDFLLLESGEYLLLEDGDKLTIGDIPCEELAGASASTGHPWPQKLVNVIFGRRQVEFDDEDFLLIMEE